VDGSEHTSYDLAALWVESCGNSVDEEVKKMCFVDLGAGFGF
jgi:hypothetical protein